MNPFGKTNENRRKAPKTELPTVHEIPLIQQYERVVDVSVPYMGNLISQIIGSQRARTQQSLGAHAFEAQMPARKPIEQIVADKFTQPAPAPVQPVAAIEQAVTMPDPSALDIDAIRRQIEEAQTNA